MSTVAFPKEDKSSPSNIAYDLLMGKEVWLKIVDKTSSRYGSIGRARIQDVDYTSTANFLKSLSVTERKLLELLEAKKKSVYFSWYTMASYFSRFRFVISFGEKEIKSQSLEKNENKIFYEYLTDYKGEPVFEFETGRREIPKKYDMLGRELKEGSFGVFAFSKEDLRFGTVVRISKAGAVYVKPIDHTNGNKTYEVRLRAGEQFLIFNKETYDDAVITKLTHG